MQNQVWFQAMKARAEAEQTAAKGALLLPGVQHLPAEPGCAALASLST